MTIRGDSGAPDEIRAEGGFLLRSKPKGKPAYSMMHHVEDTKSSSDTADVSATSDYKRAGTHATKKNNEGYIYYIHNTPNAIDVNESIRKDGVPEEKIKHKVEKETVFMGGISWKQVIGWTRVTRGSRGAPIRRETFINPEYNPAFNKFRSTVERKLVSRYPLDPYFSDAEASAREFIGKKQSQEAMALGASPSECFINRGGRLSKRDCTPKYGNPEGPVYESR